MSSGTSYVLTKHHNDLKKKVSELELQLKHLFSGIQSRVMNIETLIGGKNEAKKLHLKKTNKELTASHVADYVTRMASKDNGEENSMNVLFKSHAPDLEEYW